MNLKTFTRLELKNFLNGRSVLVVFLCIGLAVAYAVYQGGSLAEKQSEIAAQTPQMQVDHTDRMLEVHAGKELADFLYYHKFYTAHEPSDWAGFSVGQSDVNANNIKVTLLTLEGQIYNSELSNPTNQLFGNFDLSFVIVFLFPLLIIAFTHNLISAEQESGTWSLLRSQPTSVRKIFWFRIGLRFLIVSLTAIVLITLGCAFLGTAFDGRFLYAILLTLVYFAFWFGVSAFVISFGKGTTFNALSLLGVWIFLVILAPALLSSVVATTFPVSESLETTITQREGYHEKWDKPKAATMERFYKKYPQFKDIPIPEDKFTWGWYYAMQETGDFESADATERYAEKLKQRQNFTEKVAWVLPTVNTQLQFNEIASTNLESHLEYLESVREFHSKIRQTYYPHIFKNAKLTDVDMKKAPQHSFKNENESNLLNGQLLALTILSFVFISLGFVRMNRKNI